MSQNNFGCCIDFESGEGTTLIYSLEELQKRGIGPIDTLPFSIRILLEQALRNVDESKSNPEDVNLLANWNASENSSEEIPYRPARVILQDFTGVPAVVDLAAIRSAVVEMKGDYSGRADTQWKRSQKIVRAMPGTEAGKKIALQEQINRADLSVIFAEELKISELMEKLPAQSGGFQTPGQMNTTSRSRTPSDAGGHWASSWISEVIQYGILEVGPDGRFYPDETITRAEYAMAVQRLLVVATRDNSLEVRYFGESPSRFSDVPSSHPAYNSMALCSERGIMQSDVMTGKFNPAGNIDGADALLIIRTLQNSLRMTF